MLVIVLLIICLDSAQAQLQTCANAGLGPCLNGVCPFPFPTATCVSSPNGEICCENSMVRCFLIIMFGI
ncbi:hypothetical protein DICVIV_13415 [Dictyocaulus viviparus]|uniref:Uncharacterized protein n=1 Tax=Dictyocaulus viviparus TaxID=29172 RepID=A0A0D8XA34_DICVI|nr:hypothetical protein DICVIV_13415 [Dictyocaulus viviparus]